MAIIKSNKVLKTKNKMKDLNILNLLKLNFYQMLIFMFCNDLGTIVTVFQARFKRIAHSLSICFYDGNYIGKYFKLNQTKFLILLRGPHLWSKILSSEDTNNDDYKGVKTPMTWAWCLSSSSISQNEQASHENICTFFIHNSGISAWVERPSTFAIQMLKHLQIFLGVPLSI